MKSLFDLPDRIQNKIMPCPTTGCWLWLGCIGSHGYGVVSWKLKTRTAHSLVRELLAGSPPNGLQYDHLCRDRSCCNPIHIEPVTQKENLRRGRSPSAIRAASTHCVNGHEFTPENTYIIPVSGWRRCRTCVSDKQKGYYLSGGPPCRMTSKRCPPATA